MTPPALAHMGGVPETLSVLVPLALVVILLRVATKRGAEESDDEDEGGADSASS